jgi:alpha-soluble NSF attachment protein
MTDPAVEKAQNLMKQAAKKASGGGGLMGLFGGDPKEKLISAAEMYKDAAVQFKIAKMWKEAGAAYEEAANLHNKADVQHEAAADYVEASSVYKKASPEEALRTMELAADTFKNMGRFAMAGKQFRGAAELYETQVVNLDKALKYYQSAIDCFEMEGDADSTADKLKLKIAQLNAQQDKFDVAFQMYEQVANRMAENNLLKYGAKEYFLKAGLCRLCLGDVIAAKRACENYVLQLPQFADSREHKLLTTVMDAVEEGDSEKFTDSVREFDTIQKLDAFMTNLLLRVKRSINGDNDVL